MNFATVYRMAIYSLASACRLNRWALSKATIHVADRGIEQAKEKTLLFAFNCLQFT